MKTKHVRQSLLAVSAVLSATCASLLSQENETEWLRGFLEEAMRNGGRLELDWNDFEKLFEGAPPLGDRRGGPGDFEEFFRRFEEGGGLPFPPRGVPSPGLDLGGIPDEDIEKLDSQYRELIAAHRPAVASARKSTVRFWRGKLPLAYGVIVENRGWALSKASELAKADGMLRCQLPNGAMVRAEVKTVFDEYDLALVKIDARDLTPVRWWDGDNPALGTFLAAPGLEEDPLAIGVLSVSPRNLDKAFLGVLLEQDTDAVTIMQVVPDSAASRAGIRQGDRLRSINGENFSHMADVMRKVAGFQSGQTVDVEIERDGKPENLRVSLGRRDNPDNDPRASMMQQMGGALSIRRDGYPNAMQHDLPLRPDECGGPVVDLEGNVVGINIARAGRVKTYAVPSSTILQLLGDIDWQADDVGREPGPAASRRTRTPAIQ